MAERLAASEAYTDLDLVFAQEDGTPTVPATFSHCFRDLVAKAKLPPIRLHDLRHTFATLGLAAGVHPEVMRGLLGHSGIAITLDIYSHATPEQGRQAVEKIAGQIVAES